MTKSEETLFEFPCSFPLKAVGKNVDDFEIFVASIVRKHVPEFDKAAISRRLSNGGKYLAVTITFRAESQAQLNALYEEMGNSKRILMLL